MKKEFILVDYENVQPDNVDGLRNRTCSLKIFIGPNQPKIPTKLVTKIQSLGDRAEYVMLEKSGKNAMDFVIAYHIGKLSVQFPGSRFYVISEDTGYDAFLSHLVKNKITVSRHDDIGNLDTQSRPPAVPEAHIKKAIQNLSQRKTSKPATLKTLRSTLLSLFKGLPEKQIDALISSLGSRDLLKIEGGRVTYDLEKTNPAQVS